MSKLYACSVCGRIHQRGYVCEIKRKRKTDYQNAREDTGIYYSNRWRTIRGQVLEQYHHICLYSFYVENEIVLATDVHHIIELNDNSSLAFDEDNLISLSKEKHRLIHELYKEDKKKIQEQLREFKKRWKDGDRKLV